MRTPALSGRTYRLGPVRPPAGPEFGDYGVCYVRFGKAKAGSEPKRRSVLAVFDWSTEVLAQYFDEVRLRFGRDGSTAAWPSERGERVGSQRLNSRLAAYRDAVGLDSHALDFHSFRSSYVTHLIEDGHDPVFVQEQVGHEHTSTTSLYTCVSSDSRVCSLRRFLDATPAHALETAG